VAYTYKKKSEKNQINECEDFFYSFFGFWFSCPHHYFWRMKISPNPKPQQKIKKKDFLEYIYFGNY
jgi:hypothetical protein